MRKIICGIGCLFGLVSIGFGLMITSNSIIIANKSTSIAFEKANTDSVGAYRFGADFYTNVSAGISKTNDSVRATNNTIAAGIEAEIKNTIEAAYSTNQTIQTLFGYLQISLGGFISLFFLLNLFSSDSKSNSSKDTAKQYTKNEEEPSTDDYTDDYIEEFTEGSENLKENLESSETTS